MTIVRLTHDERRTIIIGAAVEIANRNGLVAASMVRVAEQCSIRTSVATVRDYFRTNSDLWRAVAAHPKATKAVRQSAESMGLV